jgi:hypothetical protein
VGWRERWVRLYCGLAAGAVAYSFGPFSLLHGWVYSLAPYADKARTPAHAVFVFQFALLTLTAYGLDRFFAVTREDDGAHRWLGWISRALIIFSALALVFLFQRFVAEAMSPLPGDQVMIAALAALALATLIHARRQDLIPAGTARTLVVLLLLFEIGSVKWFELPHRNAPQAGEFLDRLTDRAGVMDFLSKQPAPFRFEMSKDEGNVNLGDWNALQAVDGYVASVSRDLYDFLARDWYNRILMLNTVYTVAREKTREQQVEVYSDASGWKVFQNPDAWPRAWIVHDNSEITLAEKRAGAAPVPESCAGGEGV